MSGKKKVRTAGKSSVRSTMPVVWTVLAIVCTVPGLLLLPTLPEANYREALGIPALLATGVFALIVAIIEWPKWLRFRRESRNRDAQPRESE